MKKVLLVSCLMCFYVELLFSQITVGPTGTVGIGVSNPLSNLHVKAGIARFESAVNPLYLATHSSDPRIASSNKIVFYNLSNTDYIDIQVRNLYELSDTTNKKNIQNLTRREGSLINKLKQINGVSYEWKNSSVKQVGFLAQEVEKVFPELVVTNDSTGGKMMSYSHMMPYLLEAIKEQQQIIDNLTLKLNRLTEIKSAKKSGSMFRKEEVVLPNEDQENIGK